MSKSAYPYKKKVSLSESISKLKVKDDFIKVMKIIHKHNEDVAEIITENNSGIFLFFHNLKNQTYYELEEFMKTFKTAPNADKKEYTPYAKNEFTRQKGLSPKFKYSNDEKKIIRKNKKYEQEKLDSESNILYVDDLS